MSEQSIHFRHLILFYIPKEKNVEEIRNKICDVYGEDAINKRTIQRWILITGDEKWIAFDNIKRSKHRSKPGYEPLTTSKAKFIYLNCLMKKHNFMKKEYLSYQTDGKRSKMVHMYLVD
ncbi:hypothetical protein WH47_08053 [Habropoda laboriosa]|uniref:Mos1 transposase HTH domain-containing protein n=1 Tax=Habropoda laboriosa TaxID=597456 RepID=A0A0L7QPW0_9HYME|nr:hypothetical protein WH47_08053 [Habropoda laboriosa]